MELNTVMERKLPKNFKCEERLCTRAFRTGDGLRAHVKAVHWQVVGGLRTSMKAKKIDKSAIALLPPATLPYNMKVALLNLSNCTTTFAGRLR